MKAIINLDVPEWQIGQDVSVFFPDSMIKKGICELNEPTEWLHWTDDRKDYAMCPNCGYGEEGELLLSNITRFCPCCGAENGFKVKRSVNLHEDNT